jgi:hypothetical protein
MFCPCCGGRLRNKPRNGRFKQKMMMVKTLVVVKN